MTDTRFDSPPPQPGKASLLYDPKIRAIFYQVLLLGIVVFLVYEAASNAIENLRAQKIASGFGFWHNNSGFDINQKLIDYDSTKGTYGQAFWVGLLNTLLVSVIGIFFATILGFLVGIARLSKNWIISKLAMIYVEIIRNLPLLLQLFFWYNAVLKPLPNPRQSIWLFNESVAVNNRGLYVPDPQFAPGAGGSASRSSWRLWDRWRSASGRGSSRPRPASSIPSGWPRLPRSSDCPCSHIS